MAGPKRPPQAEPNRAQMLGQDEQIFHLAAVVGATERQIAETVGLPKSTVHDRIARRLAELKARTDASAEDLIVIREARLEDLYRRAYTTMVGAPRGSKEWAAGWDRCLRAEERIAKLKGLDAREPLEIVLERRSETEADAVVTAVEAVTAVLGITGERRALALEAAGASLEGGPLPEPPEDEQAPDDGRVPWPFHTGGAQYVVVRGVRYIREGDHVPDDAEVVEDPWEGEFVDEDEGTAGGRSGEAGTDGTGPAHGQHAIEAAKADGWAALKEFDDAQDSEEDS